MIVVDTSIWVSALRSASSPVAPALGPFSLPRSRKPPATANIRANSGRVARYRKVRTALAGLLDADQVLLTPPVRTELLGGARAADRRQLRRTLTALPLAYPTDDTWRLMDEWAEQARDRGERFGVGDLLIGALAREAGALVWSLDADFTRLARLKLVELYEPA